MTNTQNLTLFHAPNTRSTGALILLEELGVDYQLHVLNLKISEERKPEFIAINPMTKVPTILHGETVVTEQVAIFLYLADEFPQAGLAPKIGDPLRGPYLRWMAFYAGCFEPALIDRAQKREPAPVTMSPYGDFDTMYNTVLEQLGRGLYLLGDQFSAADVLWATALTWTTMFKLIPATPVTQAYMDRVNVRPAVLRAREKDAVLAAAQS